MIIDMNKNSMSIFTVQVISKGDEGYRRPGDTRYDAHVSSVFRCCKGWVVLLLSIDASTVVAPEENSPLVAKIVIYNLVC